MKTKLIVILTSLLMAIVISAQSYSIRVTYNTNLRSAGSLQSSIVETAPAGTTLSVVGSADRWLQISRNGNVWMADWVSYSRVESSETQTQTQTQTSSQVDNCCFVDRQCLTDQEWTDGYWAFQNNQCAAPEQSRGQTSSTVVSTSSSQIDNCCFVDRLCLTDQDWTNGYWSFQNNQCATPSQTRGQTSSQPASAGPAQVDNCCFAGWQCHTDTDWQTGYHAFQNNQCDHPGLEIEGSETFNLWAKLALDLLKNKAPQWYAYVTSGLNKLKEIPPGTGAGILIDTRTHRTAWNPADVPNERNVVTLVGEMVHEACHSHMWDEGTATTGWRNELPCVRKQVEVIDIIDPLDRFGLASGYRNTIANIENPEYWWW